ncbi:MAG: protein kinase [Armatimonadetes bacterium]|nr:protein kinase [Armatimonadota bacterium]
MAARLLAGNTLKAGTYVVVRALGPDLYLVRCAQDPYLLRDIGPIPEGLEGSGRLERLQKGLEEAKSWNHPRLARPVDGCLEKGRFFLIVERREGIQLDTMLRWRSEPLDPRLIVRWAVELAEAAAYLEAQRWPYLDSCLAAQHLFVSPSEELWIAGFGFFRLLGQDEPERAATEAAQRQFARLLVQLARCDPEVESVETSDLDRLPVELAYTGARARDGSFPDFQALSRSLQPGERTLLPAAPPHRPELQPEPSLLETMLRRPLRRLIPELALVLAAVFGLWQGLRERPVEPFSGELVYVACEDALRVVDRDTKEELAAIRWSGSPEALAVAPEGERVFVSYRDQRSIQILEARTGRLLASAPVEHPVSELVVAASGTRLLAVSPAARLVTVLEIPQQGFDLRPIAYLAASSEEFGSLALPRHTPLELVLADAGRLTRYTMEPASQQAQRELGSTGPIAASPDGRTIAVQEGAEVLLLDSDRLSEQGRLALAPGEELSTLYFSPDGETLWLAGETGSLTAYAVQDRRVLHRSWLAGPAESIAQVEKNLWIALPSRNSVVLLDLSRGTLQSELPLGAGPHAIAPVR